MVESRSAVNGRDSRTRAISLVRAITRGAGFRIRSGSTGSFLDRVTALDLPSSIPATLSPLRSLIEVLNEELTKADDTFADLVAQDPVVTRLTTLPGIGPIPASAYVAALDDAGRFGRAAQVASYLGLVPREYSSGEQQWRGRVLRSAHPHVQSLLVQAAWRVSRSKNPRTAGLRAWAQGIARRRGKKIAMVALGDASRASCSRCGETRCRMTPHGLDQRGRIWSGRSVRTFVTLGRSPGRLLLIGGLLVRGGRRGRRGASTRFVDSWGWGHIPSGPCATLCNGLPKTRPHCTTDGR